MSISRYLGTIKFHQPSLIKLFDAKLIDEAPKTARGMGVSVYLPGEKRGRTVLLPRISASLVEDLYKQAHKPNNRTCLKIADLYLAGIAVPVDSRLAAFWTMLSRGESPKIHGVVVTPEDLLHVLRAHLDAAYEATPNPRFLYAPWYTEYVNQYRSMLDIDSWSKPAAALNSMKAAVPMKGIPAVALYIYGSEGHQLYDFLILYKGKIASIGNIAKEYRFAPVSVPDEKLRIKIGTLFAVAGTLSVNKDSKYDYEHLFAIDIDDHKQAVLEPKSDEELDAFDLIRELDKVKLDMAHNAVRVARRITRKGKLTSAQLTKLGKAKAFIAKVDDANKKIDSYKDRQRKLERSASPAKLFTFEAYDLCKESSTGWCGANAPYTKICSKLEEIGFKLTTSLTKLTARKCNDPVLVCVKNKWSFI